MLYYVRLVSLALLVSVGMGSVGTAEVSQCQNPNIAKFLNPEETTFQAVHADIDTNNSIDSVQLNLRDGWLTVDFYVDEISSRKCDPDISLKYLSIDYGKEPAWYPAEWFPRVEINARGSIVFSLNYYCENFQCGHGGVSFTDYVLTLRYLPGDGVQVIGYDEKIKNMGYPANQYSINLITGTVVKDKVQSIIDGGGLISSQTLRQQFPRMVLKHGDILQTPRVVYEFLKTERG